MGRTQRGEQKTNNLGKFFFNSIFDLGKTKTAKKQDFKNLKKVQLLAFIIIFEHIHDFWEYRVFVPNF